MQTSVVIPMERRKVINREVMDELKEKLEVNVMRKENIVDISGEDGLKLMQAKNIVKAIGRGFSPVRAYRLMEDDELEIIEIKRRIEAVKARVIGSEGKTRKRIEEYTGAIISVYGKTISIIGKWEQRENAKKAVEMIMNGSEHKSVYRFLEKIKK